MGSLDWSVVPGRDAEMSAKLIAHRLSEGRAAIVDPVDGASLAFLFDPRLVTHFGLWLNYRGWAGKPGAEPYYNIGVEPCIGVADRLDLALEAGEAGLLPARGELNWDLHLQVS